ncbi:Cupredoxin [Suillus decipiens]|nr:Cupredoxin [Suillus decipiens]
MAPPWPSLALYWPPLALPGSPHCSSSLALPGSSLASYWPSSLAPCGFSLSLLHGPPHWPFLVVLFALELTEPLLVDELRIFAGQRYSVVLVADKPVDNYWVRNLPDLVNASFTGGTNSAILRYKGAPNADPTTVNTKFQNPLLETNLHALINPGAPGTPGYGNADINLDGIFYVNNNPFNPPTVPVLLQILSGAQDASQLFPNGSVIVLEANEVVGVDFVNNWSRWTPSHTSSWGRFAHAFDVVQSAGSKAFNYVNPVRRDVVSAGSGGDRMVIRWTTDNSGPWFLHCHIDWHLDAGFAVVMAESPSDTRAHLNPVPQEWDQSCPIFRSLSPSQLGGGGRKSYEEAASITTLLFPPSPLPHHSLN